MDLSTSKFQKLANNSFLFRLYLFKSLPLAFIAGIKVKKLTKECAITTVKYRWISQNPFGSMYFACQAMAAEMSTGLLVLDGIYNSTPAISMLIISNQANYYKKAVGKITFTSHDGKYVAETIAKVKLSSDSHVIEVKSVGTDETGDKVAEFVFTWSLKSKTPRF